MTKELMMNEDAHTNEGPDSSTDAAQRPDTVSDAGGKAGLLTGNLDTTDAEPSGEPRPGETGVETPEVYSFNPPEGLSIDANVMDAFATVSKDLGLSQEGAQKVIDTKATSGGAATVQAVLQHSDDGTAWSDILIGAPTPVAQLNAGASLMQSRFPLGLKRYFRITWRVGTAALTAGKFTAFVAACVQSNAAHPSGFTVK